MIGIKRILTLAAAVVAVGCSGTELPTTQSSAPAQSPSFFIGIGSSGETIATDKLDYSPGDTVRITGTGWQPGELVRLTLAEDPEQHVPRQWEVTADSAGNFSDSSFSPEEHHFGTTFTLTALGLSSGLTAQTTFTDGTFFWKGCINTNWHTPGNWGSAAGTSCASNVVMTIPGAADDVRIQNVTNDPIISAAASANTILVEPSGHLTVSANLAMGSDVTVTGTWTQTAGTVSFGSSGKKITIGSGSPGTYNQTGGTFGVLGGNAPDLLIETQGGATQSGGTLNLAKLEIKTGRTFSQSGAGSLLALNKEWKVEGIFSSTGGKAHLATGSQWSSTSTATNQFFDVEFDVSITPQAQSIGVAGNWIMDGAGNLAGSNNHTVVFNGGGNQSIGGTNSTTFRNLIINKTGGDLTLAMPLNQTVTHLLTFTAGNVVTGTNRLISTATTPASVTRTSGHVIGNLQLHIPDANPGPITYHLGTASAYTPLRIDVDGTGGTAGGLIGATFGVAHPNIATSGLNPFVSRYWKLTAAGAALSGRTYKLRLQFLSGEAGNPNTASEIRRWDGANWHSPTVGPTYTRDLISTEVNGFNTFSDFVVGTVPPADNTPPDVTINQAAAQVDPTNASTINFTVEFSEPVTGFATGDVTLSGTAPGTMTGTVTGSGTTYNVAVTGMTGPGTVIASIGAAVAKDAANNDNTASTSTDNTVTYDATAPTVTINQAAGQADPTGASPINFTVVFSEAVTGFATGDVTLSGTAPGVMTGTVTGSGATYNVAVSGMTGDGTVIASIGAAVATDAAGNDNAASTSTDNSVTYDVTSPSVTINQAAGQADPTNGSPINFTVVFNEAVTGFTGSDVSFTGSTVGGTLVATVTGGPSTYNVAVTGMTGTGTVMASIPVGSANDPVGNPNASSTSTDNSVTYDGTPPTVTINQAAGQADPAGGAAPINFTVVFSETVTGFTGTDVDLSSSTVGGSLTATVTAGPSSYNVAVTGMTGTGTVVASIPAGGATDPAGNGNTASTSTDNTVTYDGTPPTVTINQAAGQADPTNASPINFTVVFNEAVTGFTGADVSFTGSTVGGTLVATVTAGPSTYNVAVTGMTGTGTVVASIPAGSATDGVGNGNTASTSTDNSVTYDGTPPTVTINQAAGQADPTNASPINFTVVFSEPVTGFATGDVTLSGTAGATTGTVTGSGTTYSVAVSGMTGSGTVIASIVAGVAKDAANNGNTASTSTDNTVTYDVTPPTVTINQAAGQADPTNASPINFTVVFSEPVTGFATGDVSLSGTAGATTGTVTGSGTTYNVAVSGMTGDGTVIASIGADKADDGAGNGNTASTSTDNTVTYETDGPITSNVVVNPVPLNTAGTVTANVSDVATGGSNIVSAQYSIDGGPFLPMTAQDGAFNSPNENVTAALPASATTGVFEVCVNGTDAAGNTGNTECALYAVYDPSGGFVTGGGWFNSPAYACKLATCEPDGSTVGKANFGFVSKYQKGATVPVGNTEFQFKAGDLNFHSSAYQWLVVSGARAQYKGTGTINGAGNYGFLITAIDGQINGGNNADKFRIKIWDKNNGDTVVYDNEMGADDTALATTLLGGGSILIHSK